MCTATDTIYWRDTGSLEGTIQLLRNELSTSPTALHDRVFEPVLLQIGVIHDDDLNGWVPARKGCRRAFIRYIECRRWLARFHVQGVTIMGRDYLSIAGVFVGVAALFAAILGSLGFIQSEVYKAPRFCL